MLLFGLNLVLDPAKEKEKEIGVAKASPRVDLLIGIVPLDVRTLNTCLILVLPSTDMLRIEDLMGKKDSLFDGIITRISVKLIGERAAEPLNDAYRDWHENAWAGQYLAPPAEDRYYRRNAGYHAESRSRSSGWQPFLHPPTNMSGRHRTRSPARQYNRDPVRRPGPNSRVFHHDGSTEWEVIDDDWRDEQNQRSQDRRNMEYQLERAG